MSDCEMPPRTSCSAHPTASASSSLMETLRFSSPEGRKGATAPVLATTGIGDARRQRQIAIARMMCTCRANAKARGGGDKSPHTHVSQLLAVQPPFPPRSRTHLQHVLGDRGKQGCGRAPACEPNGPAPGEQRPHPARGQGETRRAAAAGIIRPACAERLAAVRAAAGRADGRLVRDQ